MTDKNTEKKLAQNQQWQLSQAGGDRSREIVVVQKQVLEAIKNGSRRSTKVHTSAQRIKRPAKTRDLRAETAEAAG